jgi:hypothetical protein
MLCSGKDHRVPEINRKQAAQLIRSSEAAYEHFFDNADDPGWIAPLAAEGFFQVPQPAERGDGWVRYPFWPESRFLVRVASRAPEQVVRIAAKFPDTDNLRVHEDVLRIAAQVPGRLARSLADRETRWLHEYRGHLLSLPDPIGDLAAHLVTEDEMDAAYALLAEALKITPRKDDKYVHRSAGEARMNDYEYGRIIAKTWPSLMERDAVRALSFLCELLQQLVKLEGSDRSADPTSVWRPAIEDHHQNLGQSLLDLLIEAVRDNAAKVAATDDVPLESVLQELRLRDTAIFDRIALNLIRELGSPACVASALADPSAAFDVSRWHEYGELLRARFSDLSADEKLRVLATLDHGYPPEQVANLTDRGVEEDRIVTWQRLDLLKRLIVIRDVLDDGHQKTLVELLDEFSEPEHPTFLSYSSSWTGPTSPFGADELRSLSAVQLVDKLRTWVPPGGWRDPTPEGLGRVVAAVIQESPAKYADAAQQFQALEPTYVRALLTGLSDAAKRGEPFAWDPVLALCQWVMSQPEPDPTVTADLERDTDWGPARRQITDLLSRGLAEGAAELDITERPRIWELLSLLANDPDPTPAQEEEFGGDNMDPATLSINTTRGEAFHGIMRYALWRERHFTVDGIRSMPEVRTTLERHLDPTVEPSAAVRSVYGQWFPQLARIDSDWSREIAPAVFPTAPKLSHLFDAAWHAYILFNQAYDVMYSILGDAYRHATTHLDEDRAEGLTGDPHKRLGDHLFFFQARGALAQIPNLLTEFWQHAPTALRTEVLASVGWSLQRTPTLDATMFERLGTTWSWIADEARTRDPASLAGFGAWFAADALPAEWRLEQALVVLKRDVHLEPDFAVYETLPRLAEASPDKVLEVLRRMITSDSEAYSPWGSVDEIKSTLRIAQASHDQAIKRQAQEIADLLGARGLTAFRDLGQS